MKAKAPQNRGAQGRNKPPEGKRFQKGQSGNPGGKPKDAVSLTHWVREIGAMTSAKAAELCEEYAKDFRAHKTGDVPLIGVVAIRIFQTIINDAPPGLTGQLWDRIDGTVETKVSTTGETTFKVVYEGEDDDRKL
jgi:hypothetical protein